MIISQKSNALRKAKSCKCISLNFFVKVLSKLSDIQLFVIIEVALLVITLVIKLESITNFVIRINSILPIQLF